MQCDFDTIGTRSTAADIETALVIHDLLRAIGFADFTIRLNNRMVLTGLLERLGLSDRSAAVLRALDKLGKIGAGGRGRRDGLRRRRHGGTGPGRPAALRNLRRQRRSAPAGRIAGGRQRDRPGRRRPSSRRCSTARRRPACPPERLRLDLSIARGLDYYTGTVFETFLDALPGIGSVCSGGRYDNLAELFTVAGVAGRRGLAGAGPAAGRDGRVGHGREGLHARPGLHPLSSTRTACTIISGWRRALRAAGIGVEVFPDPKKLGQQLKYADRRGFRIALIAGGRRVRAGTSARSRTCKPARSRTCRWRPTRPASSRRSRKILGVGIEQCTEGWALQCGAGELEQHADPRGRRLSEGQQ